MIHNSNTPDDSVLREVVLPKLEGVRQSGQNWMARCPVHGDQKASLSLRAGDVQPVVMNCKVGCSNEQVLAAVGLTTADISRPRAAGREDWPSGAVAVYDYRDENGVLLFQVIRTAAKKFWQRRPDPASRDGWSTKLGKTRRVPYRLRELAAGVAAGKTIFCVEGEKDVHALVKAGAVATCNPMGVGGGWREEYSQHFAGATVRVIADNDEPGKRHAAKVAASLRKAGCAVTVALPAVGTEKADAYDHLKAGYGIEDFRVIDGGPDAPDVEEPQEPWDEPGSLDARASLPDFPLEALPSPIREYATALSIATQTPADMAGTVVLGVLAACVGGRVVVEPVPGWREPTNLFVAPVSEPGTRKSAISAATKPLADAEAQLTAGLADEILAKQTEKDVRERYAEKCRQDAGKDPSAENIEAAKDAVKAAAEIVVPAWPRLVTDDATPEALVSLAAQQGGRIAAVSTEAGVFDSLTGSIYSSRTNLDPILKMHAGDTIRVDRRSREPEHLPSPALTVVATIQPHALRDFLGREALAGRGVLARVLWAIVKDNLGTRSNDQAVAVPVPRSVEAAYTSRITRLATDLYDDEEGNHVTLTLDDEAQTLHTAYRDRVEAMLHPSGAMAEPLPRQWGAKCGGAAARIAGCLHSAAGSQALARPIDGQTMRSAIELAEYYRAHALAAFGAHHEQEDSTARRLVVALVALRDQRARAEPTKPFTMRDLIQRLPREWRAKITPSDTQSKRVFQPVLDTLKELGWVRVTDTKTGAKVVSLHPEAEKVATPATPPTGNGRTAAQGTIKPVAAHGYRPATPGYTPAVTSKGVASRSQDVAADGYASATHLSSEDTKDPTGVAGVATFPAAAAEANPWDDIAERHGWGA